MGAPTVRRPRVPWWLAGLSPLLAVGALVAAVFVFDPVGSLRAVPPAETVAVERTLFRPGEVELRVRNDGPDAVTVAQVLVNGAYWQHEMADRTLSRLEARTVTIPYPWEAGYPIEVTLVTATGATMVHRVEVAALTPEADRRTVGIYALLGLYMGVVPVAIGLLWFGTVRRMSPRGLTFVLGFTVGLLTFLFVDTVEAGVEMAGRTTRAFDGVALFAMGGLVAALGLAALEGALGPRLADGPLGSRRVSGLVAAYLVAAGIGLHNLGEGLAVGAALAAGELALGRSLVLGFALHNTTEGVAIVAPLGTDATRPLLGHFVGLGAVAGLPTIAGAWAGGLAFDAAWATLAFGIAAGAIAQVVWTVGRRLADARSMVTAAGAGGVVLGLVFMYATGLLTP
jgi:zinc transporter ZupT